MKTTTRRMTEDEVFALMDERMRDLPDVDDVCKLFNTNFAQNMGPYETLEYDEDEENYFLTTKQEA